MREMKLFEILSRLIIQVARLQTEKAFKKKEVAEDGGEVLPKIIPVRVDNGPAIQVDLPAFRGVKAGHDFCQGRFSTAVPSDQEDQFAGVDGQIQRSKHERAVFFLVMISMSDSHQIETFKTIA